MKNNYCERFQWEAPGFDVGGSVGKKRSGVKFSCEILGTAFPVILQVRKKILDTPL